MLGLDKQVVAALLAHNNDPAFGTQFYHQAQEEHPHLAAFFFEQAKAIDDIVMEDDPDTTMLLTTQYAVAGDAAGYALLDALSLFYGMVLQSAEKDGEEFPQVSREEMELSLVAFGGDVPGRAIRYIRFLEGNTVIAPNLGKAMSGLIGRTEVVFDSRCRRDNPLYEETKFVAVEGARTTLCAVQFTLYYAPMFGGKFEEYLERTIG